MGWRGSSRAWEGKVGDTLKKGEMKYMDEVDMVHDTKNKDENKDENEKEPDRNDMLNIEDGKKSDGDGEVNETVTTTRTAGTVELDYETLLLQLAPSLKH